MLIAIGSDHAGFMLKEHIKSVLKEDGVVIKDIGTDSEESVDYPDFAYKVARAVSDADAELGILICSSGIGMSIAANKVKNIRAALCATPKLAEMSKLHNNANIVTLGADYISKNLAVDVIRKFLETPFSEAPRHIRRVNKISDIESKVNK
ncbi:ribose 5-phosphate isomerase B [bacterium]|nr:ribose 5-phosphate isomerase B [bacterium]